MLAQCRAIEELDRHTVITTSLTGAWAKRSAAGPAISDGGMRQAAGLPDIRTDDISRTGSANIRRPEIAPELCQARGIALPTVTLDRPALDLTGVSQELKGKSDHRF